MMKQTVATRFDRLREHITNEFRRRSPRSAAAMAAASAVMPGGDTRTTTFFEPYPLVMRQGAGCRMTDLDGHTYLDFLGNYTSLIHGHAHPAIIAAVTEQLHRGTAYGSPHEAQTQLAAMLCERVPSLERVRFCNSGTEATLHAIRAAKAYTGRPKILKMEGGYHGSHDAADVSVSPPMAQAGSARAPISVPDSPGLFAGVVADVLVAPFNDLEATVAIIEAHAADLAAVILEPVLGSAGVIPATQAYLQGLRDVTTRIGALLIFDEVVTLRLDVGGVQARLRVTPDLTAMGKIIGGGFPIGAFGGRAEVMAQFDPRAHRLHQGGTYNGNAISMRAGCVALEWLPASAVAQLNAQGDWLREQLNEELRTLGVAGHVGGVGSLLQMHLQIEQPVRNYREAQATPRATQELLHLALLNRGIFAAARGEYALSTPMQASDLDEAVVRFRAALTEIAELLPPLARAAT
jgi:glutamate-1-semialdehyde 2,1-aminomutase